jgi:hypothetical protein
MLSLNTKITTTQGVITPIKDLIANNNQSDTYVYTCEPNGAVIPARFISGNICLVPGVELTTENGVVLCTNDHLFPVQNRGYKKAYDILNEDIITGLCFEQAGTLVYDHNIKLFVPPEYLMHEAYATPTSRNILDIIPNDAEHIKYHAWIISTITISEKQICDRLANDMFFKQMIGVDHLTRREVKDILDYFELEYIDKVLTDEERKLEQYLQTNIPLDTGDKIESLFDNVKNNVHTFIGAGMDVTDVTIDVLDQASLLLGYSNVDHITSVRHLYGSKIIGMRPVGEIEMCSVVLDHGTSIGLTCGIFAGI